jgi:two-component system, cell cycle response regulator DivK
VTRAKILIVEDNPLNLRLVRDLLEFRGHEIEAAATISEARERLLSFQPDLLLVDVEVPGGGGSQLLREIRADPSRADLPVIAVTAQAMQGDRERLLKSGFDAYFSKPIDTRAFGPAIESFLKKG